MHKTSINISKHRYAVCLASFLLAGPVLVSSFAKSAPPPVLVAAVDINVVLEAISPPPRHEVIVERDRPSRDHVWIKGYWANRRGHHEWIDGHWERPPHGRTVWIEPRWEKHDRGYVFIEGYWAEGPS